MKRHKIEREGESIYLVTPTGLRTELTVLQVIRLIMDASYALEGLHMKIHPGKP